MVTSTPTIGGSSRARILFQVLLASAKKKIYVTSPYFLPDHSVRSELVRAMRERGVEVKILTPGRRSDHSMSRSSSRALFGDILKNGGHVYEYQPAMVHAKILIVDGQWCVLGSTNFDNRSFELNDEVNDAALDAQLAARLEDDFARALSQSKEVTCEQWRRRPIWQRIFEWAGLLVQRQQ